MIKSLLITGLFIQASTVLQCKLMVFECHILLRLYFITEGFFFFILSN